MKLITLAVALGALVATASGGKAQQQIVALVLTRGDDPVPAAVIRLHSLRNCAGAFQEAATDNDGHARFMRVVEIGGVGVITDELSVCIRSAESWWPIFSSLHGPAPGLIELRCDLAHTKGVCTARFDGRSVIDFDNGEHDA